MVIAERDRGLMFERFTNPARHVVVLAQEEARGLKHNYIGTEHLLLGLLGETDGVAARVLGRFGMSLATTREEVRAIIGTGQNPMSGHIPFTPRAKKTLELSLREALQLRHGHIGTEHILLGVIREGSGVAAQIMRDHGDLLAIRMAVLDVLPPGQPGAGQHGPGRRWRRGRGLGATSAAGVGEAREPEEQTELRTTPAADNSLNEAARLAGYGPVGSHHLLLAALADPETAAARALAALGVDLAGAREALRNADVTGTSDEPEEEAGRRQMTIRVTEDRLSIDATDDVLVDLGRAAVEALGEGAGEAGTIRGDLPVAASLSQLWLAVRDALDDIRQRATPITAEAATAKEDLGNVGGESVTTSEGPAAAAD
jgi:ATP-dependent Clp protease ATP-binding subunit ClpA